MNRTPIEWADYTCNPIVGCLNDCGYCYARSLAEGGLGEYGTHPKGERFQPRFLSERLVKFSMVRKPSRVFVGSMAEMFGPWVPEEWIADVLAAMQKAPQHTYQLLTKFPENMVWRTFPGIEVWQGVTATDQASANTAVEILTQAEPVRFISFEPLLGPVVLDDEAARAIEWVIIGPQTGQGAVPPDRRWAEQLIAWADRNGIPYFLKRRMEDIGFDEHQEYPIGAHG